MHTFLITKGSKKTRIAKIQEMVGFDYQEPNLDTILIDVLEDKKQISIDQIKNAIRESVFKPIQNDFKYIIIHNANLMTLEAQNALLKSLEEPAPHIKYILEVNHEKNILDTISSRCLKIYIHDRAINDISLDTKKIANEFVEANIGIRLDILQKLKSKLSNRDSTLGFLNNLLIIFHENLKYESGSLNRLRNIRSKIQLVNSLKWRVENYNVNIFLLLENIAINL